MHSIRQLAVQFFIYILSELFHHRLNLFTANKIAALLYTLQEEESSMAAEDDRDD